MYELKEVWSKLGYGQGKSSYKVEWQPVEARMNHAPAQNPYLRMEGDYCHVTKGRHLNSSAARKNHTVNKTTAIPWGNFCTNRFLSSLL